MRGPARLDSRVRARPSTPPPDTRMCPPAKLAAAGCRRGRIAGHEQAAAALGNEARAVGVAGQQSIIAIAAGLIDATRGRRAGSGTTGLNAQHCGATLFDDAKARARRTALLQARPVATPYTRVAGGRVTAALRGVTQLRAGTRAALPAEQRTVAAFQSFAGTAYAAHDARVAAVACARVATSGERAVGDRVAAVCPGTALRELVSQAATLSGLAICGPATACAIRRVAQVRARARLKIQPGVARVAAALQQVARTAKLAAGAHGWRTAHVAALPGAAELGRRAGRFVRGHERRAIGVTALDLSSVAAALVR